MFKPTLISLFMLLSFFDSYCQKETRPTKRHVTTAPLKSRQPTAAALKSYLGIYQLTTDKSRTITITKENDYLLGEISGQTSLPLVFKSVSKFEFEGVTDASCEFVSEKGKVVKIIVFQNGKFIWNKIK